MRPRAKPPARRPGDGDRAGRRAAPLTGGRRRAGKLVGADAISGAREIWVRDVYLSTGLSIPPDGVVVDLGANMGNFTTLAMARTASGRASSPSSATPSRSQSCVTPPP